MFPVKTAVNKRKKTSTNTLSKLSGDFALLTNLDVAIDICYAKSKRSFELVSILPKVLVKPSFNNIDYPHNVSLLIDTGASFSCMTQSLFDRLRLSIGIKHESRQRPAPIAANGMSLNCIGETVFDLKLSFCSDPQFVINQELLENIIFSDNKTNFIKTYLVTETKHTEYINHYSTIIYE